MSNPRLSKQWNSILKSSINDLSNSEQLEISIRPPEPPIRTADSSLNFFQQRKKKQQVQPIDIDNPKPHSGITRLPLPAKPPPKAMTPLVSHREDQKRNPPVIDLSRPKQDTIDLVEKVDLGRQRRRQVPMKGTLSKQEAMKKQMEIVDDMNKPQWLIHKEERRAINSQKYPRSQKVFTDMHEHPPSYDLERCALNKERKNQYKRQKVLQQQEQRRLKKERELMEYSQITQGMIGMPSKLVKPNQDTDQQKRLRNKDVLQQLQQEEGEEEQPQKQQSSGTGTSLQHPRIQRFGLDEIVRPQAAAPQFVNIILKQNYGVYSQQREIKRIPDNFQNHSIYKKIFHYLITNECIADMRQRLLVIERDAPDPIMVNIRGIRTGLTDGLAQIYLKERPSKDKQSQQSTLALEIEQQKRKGQQNQGQPEKNGKDVKQDEEGKKQVREEFKLKNLSLSKYRVGLVCSSREFKQEYYGVPARKGRQFAFIGLLVTPQTKEDMREVKLLSAIKEDELEYLLRQRRSRKACFFDLQKLTTHVRQYLAVTNIPYSQLAPFIYEPAILDKQLGTLVPHREKIDSILAKLNQIYNPTQWQSIRDMVIRQRGFVLLQGPPGTGKTSTLMGLLSAQYDYLRKIGDKRKILICAPSNAAVDHIVKRLAIQGLKNDEGASFTPKMLRAGIVDTQDSVVRSYSLDEQCEKLILENNRAAQKVSKMTTAQMKDRMMLIEKQLRKMTQGSDDCRKKRQELLMLQNSLFSFRKQKQVIKPKQFQELQRKLIGQADIVLTTLASSGNDRLLSKLRGQLACLIVDEAAQATQPTLLIALQTGVSKVLLIGDPCQLPSTCISPDANVTLFNRSIFERFLHAGIKPYFLNIQYRMTPLIRQFPSAAFYQNRLVDDESIASREQPLSIRDFGRRNIAFVDMAFGHQERRGDSYMNEAEVRMAGLLVRSFLSGQITIGVITPYQAQRRAILRDCHKHLKAESQLMNLEKYVMVNTVDSFQGQEKDVIIVSTVRANQEGRVGFLTDQRRINVTLTRAKHMLIVVGHGDTLGSNNTWNSFLSWIQRKKLYFQVNFSNQFRLGIERLFLDYNDLPIKRKYYKHLSTDVRRKQRNSINKKDFQVMPVNLPSQRAQREEGQMIGDRSQGGEGARKSMWVPGQEEMAGVMKQKLKMEEKEVRAQEICRKVESLQTEQKYKNDPAYAYLFQ